MSDLEIKNVDRTVTPLDTTVEIISTPKEETLVETTNDPENLYESLHGKRELFKMLELQGYIKKHEIETIQGKINKALADLEKIIEEESGEYLEQFIQMES